MKFSSFANIIVAIAGVVPVSASTGSSRSQLRRILEGNNHDHEHDHEDDHNGYCVEHDIDFVMVEGDALHSSVEEEFVWMLKNVGINVNTVKLSKEEFNEREQEGDFHLSFSETWGAPYDPHAYASGWIAQDEGHFQALSGLEEPSREEVFDLIRDVLQEENHIQRGKKWENIYKIVHDAAVMLPLWGARIPTVLNSKRLTSFQPGNQQFDYPVNYLEVVKGSPNVTIAPGAQTGLFNSVGRLDPHTYRPNEFFANNWVYEGLVSYGAHGQIVPALAFLPETTAEDVGERHTFQLRSGVKFHDGEDWNCAAAKLNLDHVLAAPLRTSDFHGWYGMMDQIKSWSCTGDMELVIVTKGKYYPFLQELSFIRPLRFLSPKAFANDADPTVSNSCHIGWNDETGSISADGQTITCAGTIAISGTGPFKLGSRTPVDVNDVSKGDSQVVFSRHDDYWGKVPSFESLIVNRYDDSDAVKAALLDGSLDLVWGSGVLPTEELVALDEDETNNLSVYHSDDIQNVIVLLNSGKPPLDDINIRKTIIHAIDKMKIINHALDGIYKPVDNVFPIDAPYSDVSLTPRWDYDLEKAEFLNCPVPVKTDKSLALGLGLGLGAASLLLLGLAVMFKRRNVKLEAELKEFLMNSKASSA